MSTFLLAVLGTLVGLLLVVALAWIWLKRKLARFVRDLGEALGAAGGVSPFRITLEPSADLEWSGSDTVDSVTAALADLGYEPAGDFRVPEMAGVKLRGLVNGEACTLAALYEHPQVERPLLDLMRLHEDRHHVLVSTAPEDGMDAPPRKIARRVTHDLGDQDAVHAALESMHEQLLAESAGRTPVPIAPRLFALTFTTAYAAEMDWRIARGGVTADEVRRAAAAGGQEPPDEDSVETVQGLWRSAIDDFVSEEAQRAFLATATVSAAEWEQMRERVLVVHEHSQVPELVESLASDLYDAEAPDEEGADEEEDRYEALEQGLREAFGAAGAMDGFRAARDAMPVLAAFEHLGDVHAPWRGSIYLRPAEAA